MTTKRKAKRRLTNIRSKEVSFVDDGANEEEYLIVKNKGGDDKLQKKEIDLFKSQINGIVDNEGTETSSDDITNVGEKLTLVIKSIEDGNVDIDHVKETVELLKNLIPEEDDIEEDVDTEKAGKKLSKDRLKKLRDMHEVLKAMIEEADEDTNGGKKGMTTSVKKEEKKEENENKKEGKEKEDESKEKGKKDKTVKKDDTDVSNADISKSISDFKVNIDTQFKSISKRLDDIEKDNDSPGRNGADESDDESEIKKDKGPVSIFQNVIGSF